MKRAAIFLLAVVLLTGCVTREVYISPTLPEFSIAVPDRPDLLEIPAASSIPAEVNINFDLMAGYAESLETIIESWESFYYELIRVYQTDRETEK